VIASPHFYLYRSNPEFSSRPPDLSRQEFEDEVADLSHDPQVSSLQTAPDQNVQFAVAKFEGDAGADADWLTRDKDNLYLWLVRIDDVRICLENGALGQSTARKRLSHTNLSGGADAHCGGELWFRDEQSVYINGGSSRYTPRNPDELDAITDGLRSAGFLVCSFGWNTDRGTPKRTLRRGEVEWR